MDQEELIKGYLEDIVDRLKETGSLNPCITVFAEQEDSDKPAIVHIPIPGEYMEHDSDKDMLVEDVLPIIFEEVNKRFKPFGLGWASEAWMRIADDESAVKNYKSLPIKKEVVFVSIETDVKTECILYEIKRNGHQVNSEGDLIDIISLEKLDDLSSDSAIQSGRFSGLYKKLKKSV
jgi:hypothetical protein